MRESTGDGDVAVVTILHGRHDHLERQHESLTRGTRRPDHYLAVAMDDLCVRSRSRWGLRRQVRHLDADPRGLPLAAARNAGSAWALELGADVVVFLDVDCLAGPGLVAAYAAAAARERATVWSGPVTYLDPPPPGGYRLDDLGALDAPHRARSAAGHGPDLFWSLSFALHREAWERVGGFCEDYVGYGGEDTDFGHLAVARGLRHRWLDAARAYHQWHPVSSPPVEHLDDILRNGAVFRARWGTWPMRGWLEQLADLGLVTEDDGEWRRTRDDPAVLTGTPSPAG